MNEFKPYKLKDNPVAIIGMASSFAEADNLQTYWENIINAKDCIKEVPESRWSIEDFYDPDPQAADKTYCKMGGFLPELSFNPLEFGLPPNLLEVTDTSQLISLIIARDALADAGYGIDSQKLTRELRQKTSVILGVGGGQKLINPLMNRLQAPIWRKVLKAQGVSDEGITTIVDNIKKAYVEWNENSFPGLLGNVIAGRIANRFDLGGVNCVVDAACAAALSALNMAVTELITGRCDMAISGGVDTDNSPFMYMCFSKTPAFSQTGKIRPFDAESDGMLIGEGIGMVILKRLADAKRDGDRVYAVIKGIGTSSDGKFKSIYAPRSEGQQLAMRRAYVDADVSPQTVGLVEAHGTGTAAGDPTEFNSLKEVFTEGKERKDTHVKSIALGSVKSQIGHTKAAAGSAGLIKAALSLYHKILPPTINVKQPHPNIQKDDSPFYLNTSTRPWIKGEHARRAGVSAFGFGGVNVHVVLEEEEIEDWRNYRIHDRWYQHILHAESIHELQDKLDKHFEQLEGEKADIYFQHLISQPKPSFFNKSHAKVGLVFQDKESLISQIVFIKKKNVFDRFWQDGARGISFIPPHVVEGKVAVLFSGQGSQYLHMAKDLVNGFPEMREAIALANECMEKRELGKVSEAIYPSAVFDDKAKSQQEADLKQTFVAQPAIGAVSMGMFNMLRRSRFQADMYAGHSFGELTALWAAGTFNEEDFLSLAIERGKAMHQASERGQTSSGMIAVRAGKEKVESLLQLFPQLRIANFNAPNQLVVGGAMEDIVAFQQHLQNEGIHGIQLPVSAAFHTSFVGGAKAPFSEALSQINIHPLRQKVYANITAKPYSGEPQEIKNTLEEQLLAPVNFQEMIERMYEDGARIFLEIGPRGVLSNLVGEILTQKNHVSMAVNVSRQANSIQQLLSVSLSLKLLGMDLAEIDPYQRQMLQGKVSSSNGKAFELKISGNNYVSNERLLAFEKAIEEVEEQKKLAIVDQVAKDPFQESVPEVQAEKNGSSSIDYEKLLFELREEMRSEMKAQLSEIASVYNAKLNDIVGKIEKLQAKAKGNGLAISNGNQDVEKEKLIERSSNGGHSKGTEETSKINNPYEVSSPSSERSSSLHTSPTILTEAQTKVQKQEIIDALLAVISSKTGYPVEMLALEMDLEADLGIDSIKRVEILGSMQEQFPSLRDADPQVLAEMRTLEEIVEKVPVSTSHSIISQQVEREIVGDSSAADVPSSTITHDPQTESSFIGPKIEEESLEIEEEPLVQPQEQHPTISNEEITEIFIKEISQKTGYPAELLEPTMDLASDLGIDSIKRMEILGDLQKHFPALRKVDPQELAEIRTILEIVDQVSKMNLLYGSPSSQPSLSNTNSPINKGSDPSEEELIDSGISAEIVSQQLLEVISEKTGYPVEMLEMDMDLEADLGIDSIKRVEILGSMQKEYPELKKANPQLLAELRTLQEIVDQVSMSMPSASHTAKKKVDKVAETQIRTIKKLDEGELTTFSERKKWLASPDFLVDAFPHKHVCMVIAHAHPFSDSLLQKLRAQGIELAYIEIPQHTSLSESNIEAYVEEVAKEKGKIGGCIYVASSESVDSRSYTNIWNQQHPELAQVFWWAKYLHPHLNQSFKQGRASFMIIHRQNDEQNAPFSPFHLADGVYGSFTKSLQREWVEVYVKHVHFSSSLAKQEVIDRVISEWNEPHTLYSSVSWVSSSDRLISSLSKESSKNELLEFELLPSDVLLVSGGARGVTAECLRKLAKHFPCTFILVGSSSHEVNLPDWMDDKVEERTAKRNIMENMKSAGEKPTIQAVNQRYRAFTAAREINQQIRSLEALGCRVEYLQADISQVGKWQDQLKNIQKEMGSITGLIHGAGRLADKNIEKKTEQDIEKVWGVKVRGLFHLMDCLDPGQLRYLSLFSSVAAWFGNAGQTDYATANGVLNQFAISFKEVYPDCHVKAINWGPWDSGMVSPELKKYFTDHGIKVISLEEGTNIFVNQLAKQHKEEVITVVGDELPSGNHTLSKSLRTYYLRRTVSLAENPFLQDHIIVGNPVLPMVHAVSWLGHLCTQQYPEYHLVAIEHPKLFNGIIFKDFHALACQIEATEIYKDKDEIRVVVKVWSEDKRKLPRYHYQAEVVMASHEPAIPFFHHEIDPEGALSGKEVYEKRIMFHGPIFQGIDQVLSMTKERIVMRCLGKNVEDKLMGQYPVHKLNPILTDVQYQGMGVWVRAYYQASGLPVKGDRVDIYRPIPFDTPFYTTANIQSHSPFTVKADVSVYDEEGKLYMRTLGAEVAISTKLDWTKE